MNYKQIKVYLICFIFSMAEVGLAQQNLPAAQSAESATSTILLGRQSQPTHIQSGAIPTSSGGVQSMNNAGKKTQDKNMASSIVSGVIGAGLVALGVHYLVQASNCAGLLGSCTAPLLALSAMNFAMGSMALQQSATNLAASKKGGQTAASTSAYSSGSSWGTMGENIGTDPLDNPALKEMIDVNKLKQGLEQAKKMGIDGKSPVKINGKEFKPSDFSSAESMLAAGLPKDLVDKAMANVAKLKSEATKRVGAQTAVAGYEEGTSSNSSATAASAYNTDSSPITSGYGRSPRDPASISVAGLTKNFNGDPIGVAADSIFQMMTRRYKLKEKQNTFIDQATSDLQK